MTRPRLLDLFCGAGGAAVGYHRAGFDVVGIDIVDQPHYPFKFHQADAMTVKLGMFGCWHHSGFECIPRTCLGKFDVIHASPPCQAYTTMSNRHRGNGGKSDTHPSLIAPTRDRLQVHGLPYVIENVPGARRELRDPITLHGGMFGLGVQRPRLFESNVLLLGTRAPATRDPVGVYGKVHDGRRLFDRADGTTQYAAGSLEDAQAAMGIDWMTWPELTEAIPPAYTTWIGEQLLAAIEPADLTGQKR